MPEVDFDINVTALYDAIGKSDWEAASSAIKRDPIEAETWVVRHGGDDKSKSNNNNILWRFLPLHSACARLPPSSFVRDLLKAHPEAASLPDASGMHPLHYACGNRASKSVIRQLIECYPPATKESDPQGMLPLHYVSQWGPSEEGILELLLETYPEGVMALNVENMNPLDLCGEGNFDGWKDALAVMEGRSLKRKQHGHRRGGSMGGGSTGGGSRKLTVVTVPREMEKEDDERSGRHSVMLSTIEVPRNSKVTSSSSRSRRHRSSSRTSRGSNSSPRARSSSKASSSRRDHRSSSRSKRSSSRASQSSRAEREAGRRHIASSSRDDISKLTLEREVTTTTSNKSKRSSPHNRGRTERTADYGHLESRDEGSTPRQKYSEGRSAATNNINARMPPREPPSSSVCSLDDTFEHQLSINNGRGSSTQRRDPIPTSGTSEQQRSIDGNIDRSVHSSGSGGGRGGMRPQSISCSLASPRYHEMKTPRSSGGRGPPGFHFGGVAQSARSISSLQGGNGGEGNIKTPRSTSGRSVEFDFAESASVRSSQDVVGNRSSQQQQQQQQVNSIMGNSQSRHPLSRGEHQPGANNRQQQMMMSQHLLAEEKEAQRQTAISERLQLSRENEVQRQMMSQLAEEKEAQRQAEISQRLQLSRENEAQRQMMSQLSEEKEAQRQISMSERLQLSQENEAQRQMMSQLSEEKEAQRLMSLGERLELSQENEAQRQMMDRLAQEKEAQQHRLKQLAEEKNGAHYQNSVLQSENAELRAKLANHEGVQKENDRLKSELVRRDAIRVENKGLRVELEHMNTAHEEENKKLRAKLRELHGVQSRLTKIVDIAERRDEARIRASSERRKKLLEMLAMEEKQDQAEEANYLYEGEALGSAFGRQIQGIDGVRREMLDQSIATEGDGLV